MATPVDVALAPALVPAGPPGVAVLMDALDGGPLVAALLGRGARAVTVVDPRAAQPPFAGPEPPAELALPDAERLDPAGRELVLRTVLARPLRRVAARSRRTLVGSLLNVRAAGLVGLRAAAELAAPLIVVCAPPPRGRGPALENAFAAGVLVRRLRELAVELRAPIELGDGAKLAQALLDHFAGPREALARSAAGERLLAAGRQADLALAARIDRVAAAPTVEWPLPVDTGGPLRLTAAR